MCRGWGNGARGRSYASVRENGFMEFDLESWLVHAGTERGAGSPLAPPLLATSTMYRRGSRIRTAGTGG